MRKDQTFLLDDRPTRIEFEEIEADEASVVRVSWTGEVRVPRRGEWYIEEGRGHRADGSTTERCRIAKLVRLGPPAWHRPQEGCWSTYASHDDFSKRVTRANKKLLASIHREIFGKSKKNAERYGAPSPHFTMKLWGEKANDAVTELTTFGAHAAQIDFRQEIEDEQPQEV